MRPDQQEQLDILRRIAERGRTAAESYDRDVGDPRAYQFTDLFQHILDELDRLAVSLGERRDRAPRMGR